MGRRAEGPQSPAWGSPGLRSCSWQAVLLAACILSFGFQLTQARDINVTVSPPQVLEGESVTLTPEGSTAFLVCMWYRGPSQDEATRIFSYLPSPTPTQQNGSSFSERETAGPDCSLHIKSVMLSDNGTYTVSKIRSDGQPEIGHGHLEILEILSPPVLWPQESIVNEHTNVTLHCTTSTSATVTVSWLKDGEPVPAKSVISERNRTLTVPDVGKHDEGMYTCVATNPVSNATSNPGRIALEYGPERPVIDPQDSAYKEGSTLNLSCFAISIPPANYSWWRDGQKLEDQKDSQLLILDLSITDAGNYTCNATNDYTGNSNTTTLEIRILVYTAPGGKASLSPGAIVGIVIGCLAGVVLIVAVLYFAFRKSTSFGRMEQHASNGNIPSAPGHNQGVTDNKPKAGEEDIQYTTLAFSAAGPPQPGLRPTTAAPSEGSTVYLEIKKK